MNRPTDQNITFNQSHLPSESPILMPETDQPSTTNLKPLTAAASEPELYFAEQQRLSGSKTAMQRLRGTGAVAATSLLAASLLLSACGSDEDDCIISSPASSGSGASSFTSSYVLPTPNPASIPVTPGSVPVAPGSAQFTSGQATAANQTYCRSRRTGGYYWYTGTRYYGGISS